jgi:polyferredoxin
MTPTTRSFIQDLAGDLTVLGLLVACGWLITRRSNLWSRFVEHDVAFGRRIGLPNKFAEWTKRFCLGRGIIVFLWVFILLSVVFLIGDVSNFISARKSKPSVRRTNQRAAGKGGFASPFHAARPWSALPQHQRNAASTP